MKVSITLDRYDGVTSQAKECDVEDVNMRDLIWYMMESDVCGFTITKLVNPSKLIKKMESTND